MALITISVVVDVIAHAVVLAICLRRGVAGRALKYRVIARIRVASRANALRVSVGHREPCMVECCAAPCRRRVARLAGGRESGRDVIRIGRGLVNRLVAAVAIRRQARVVVIYVATAAGNRRVRAGQSEACAAVIEGPRAPGDRVVAEIAARRVSELNVIYRNSGVVVVGLVAGDASRAAQIVVVVDVARRTQDGCVRASQGESRRRMVERSRRPDGCRMTQRAVGGESSRAVARIVRALVVRQVAS